MISSVDQPTSEKPRLLRIGALALGATALLLIAYGASRKFIHDRESAMNFQPHQIHTQVERESGKPVTRTYTQKEIEDARKQGKKLPGLTNLPPNLPNQAGQDAVQRSLRTLDEINRINEMNRRLMEQQQRNQQQR